MDAAGMAVGDHLGEADSQARLADAARPRQREQPHPLAFQQRRRFRHRGLPAQEGGGHDGQGGKGREWSQEAIVGGGEGRGARGGSLESRALRRGQRERVGEQFHGGRGGRRWPRSTMPT